MNGRPNAHGTLPTRCQHGAWAGHAWRGRSSPLRSFLVAAPLVLLAGCPSPDVPGQYDSFLEDTKDAREEATNVKLDVGGQLEDISGTFLLALDTVISPGLPLQFIAEVTFTAEGEGGLVSMTLQPLALEQGSQTTPRDPIGDIIMAAEVEVGAGGGFTMALGTLDVSGGANPITGGDIQADVTLEANIINTGIFCGLATGDVFKPIEVGLAGSTFAAVRIDATDPASLPTELLLSCPEGDVGDSGGDSGGGDSGGASSGG